MLTRSGKLLRNLPDLVEHYRNQKDGLPVLLAGSCTYFDPPQQPPDTYINFVRSQSRRATRKEGDYENTRTNISSTTAKHPRTADPKTQEQLYENSSDSPYENARDAIDEAGWCKKHTRTHRHIQTHKRPMPLLSYDCASLPQAGAVLVDTRAASSAVAVAPFYRCLASWFALPSILFLLFQPSEAMEANSIYENASAPKMATINGLPRVATAKHRPPARPLSANLML